MISEAEYQEISFIAEKEFYRTIDARFWKKEEFVLESIFKMTELEEIENFLVEEFIIFKSGNHCLSKQKIKRFTNTTLILSNSCRTFKTENFNTILFLMRNKVADEWLGH